MRNGQNSGHNWVSPIGGALRHRESASDSRTEFPPFARGHSVYHVARVVEFLYDVGVYLGINVLKYLIDHGYRCFQRVQLFFAQILVIRGEAPPQATQFRSPQQL
jgi:hypothetical protein